MLTRAADAHPVMRLLRSTAAERGARAEALAIKKYRKLNPQLLDRRFYVKEIKRRRPARKNQDKGKGGSVTT